MEQPSNQVTEAYEGEYGEEVAQKVKERMDWVISQVEGTRVLEIGCNQGQISLLLGREGKNVIGMDKDEEAIRFANEALEKESEQTKRNVEFRQGDFMEDQLEEAEFDTVILSEVLEQVESIQDMLKAVNDKVKVRGTVIISVPFGLNGYSDQKRTFYLQDIYQEVKQFFKIEDIAFIGDSVGLIATNSTNKNRGPIPQRYIQKLEEAFYQLEKEWIEKKISQEEAIRQLKQEKERLQADLLAAEAAVEEQSHRPASGEKATEPEAPMSENPDISEIQEENKALRQEKNELLELNEMLRSELKTSTKLNLYWEKELNRLRDDLRKLDEKWAKKFRGLKKQYQAIFRGYKLYYKRLRQVKEKK